MNAKTLEAVRKHGESILKAFPCAVEQDAVALCKKLRRIENPTHRAMEQLCNGEIDDAEADKVCAWAILRLKTLLGCHQIDIEERGVFVNRDPRGCALKIGEDWTNDWNNAMRQRGFAIAQDWGGYGLLAPDLNHQP
jgi:hypothetical protein